MNLLEIVRSHIQRPHSPANIAGKLVFAVFLMAATLSLAFGFSQKTPEVGGQDVPPAVHVTTKRDSAGTHFYVENKELCEITMTFDVDAKNLKSDVTFPYSATFPAGKVTEAFVLSPKTPGTQWEYSYTNYFKLGSSVAVHDDSVVYHLPYEPGKRRKVTQGYNGEFSHQGQCAIDWQMPEGSPVYAARGGMVVKTKDDSNTGGAGIKYDRFNNYVLIRHSDGTLGHYCHLQQNGVVVRPGQWVEAGQLIAHSGNTGFSTGGHLHFSVFKTRNGRERITIPVKFRTSEEGATMLVEGHRYTPPVETVHVATAPATAGGSSPSQARARAAF